jgi:hypothetical protein
VSAEGFSFAIDVFNITDAKAAAELGDRLYDWLYDQGVEVAMLMSPLNEQWERLDNV